MSDAVPALLWPGDHRAGALFSDAAVVRAMVAVEAAWLAELLGRDVGLAAPDGPDDLTGLAVEAEASGTPVPALVARLRSDLDRGGDEQAARWLHRGLTSQDVLDTAVMLCARDAAGVLLAALSTVLQRLAELAGRHRSTPMLARTLTQPAVPYRFGLKAAGWLNAVADARDDLHRLTFPAQLGGAAGTLAATVELLAARGKDDPPAAALDLGDRVACRLELTPAPPWDTARAPVTRLAAAMAGVTGAAGRVANDVAVLGRPEIGELREGTGGGSSTMPQKANPVLAVLLRRAAATAPLLAAQVQLAAATAVDERPDGSWHTEWPALAQLVRHAVTAADQLVELVTGLVVDVERMAANLAAAGDDVRAEQRAMAAVAGVEPAPSYDGAADALVSAALTRVATP